MASLFRYLDKQCNLKIECKRHLLNETLTRTINKNIINCPLGKIRVNFRILTACLWKKDALKLKTVWPVLLATRCFSWVRNYCWMYCYHYQKLTSTTTINRQLQISLQKKRKQRDYILGGRGRGWVGDGEHSDLSWVSMCVRHLWKTTLSEWSLTVKNHPVWVVTDCEKHHFWHHFI